MAIKYRLVSRHSKPGDLTSKKLLYAYPVSEAHISFKRLCQQMSKDSTVGETDVKAVLSAMVWSLRFFLEQGMSVDCGELGSFRVSFGSEGVEDAAKFFPQQHIRNTRILFTPRKGFRELRDISYERIGDIPQSPDSGTNPGGGGESGGGGAEDPSSGGL